MSLNGNAVAIIVIAIVCCEFFFLGLWNTRRKSTREKMISGESINTLPVSRRPTSSKRLPHQTATQMAFIDTAIARLCTKIRANLTRLE